LPYAYIRSHTIEIGVPLKEGEQLDYRFASVSLAEGTDAIDIGRDLLDDQSVSWKPDSLSNEHAFVVSGSGEGKTNFIKHCIDQMVPAMPETRHIVLDMHGEYGDLAAKIQQQGEAATAQYINIAESGIPFTLLRRFGDIPDDIRLENTLGEICSANPQIGNVQKDTLRQVLASCIAVDADNLTVRKKFEQVGQPNLVAQLAPINLLLRSPGSDMSALLSSRITILDVSAFQDPRTRAALAIFTCSQVFQHQMQQWKSASSQLHPIRIWIEEASTLRHAHPLLKVVFQQARKFRLSAAFVTQLESEVPEYVLRNTATKVYFRSAARLQKTFKPPQMPNGVGEAMIVMDEKVVSVRIPEFIGNGLDLSRQRVAAAMPLLAAVNSRTGQAEVSQKTSTGHRPYASLSEPSGMVVAYCTEKGYLLVDPVTGVPQRLEESLSALPHWTSLGEYLPRLIDGNLNDKSAPELHQLLKAGLIVKRGGQYRLVDGLARAPIVPHKQLQLVEDQPLPGAGQLLSKEQESNLRAISASLWALPIPEHHHLAKVTSQPKTMLSTSLRLVRNAMRTLFRGISRFVCLVRTSIPAFSGLKSLVFTLVKKTVHLPITKN
jgi:hypothetical protein